MDSRPRNADSPGPGDAADSRRRILAIVGGSSGNLVEWYDFYVYSFLSLYFAPAFFPSGDRTTQLLNAAGIFAASISRSYTTAPSVSIRTTPTKAMMTADTMNPAR